MSASVDEISNVVNGSDGDDEEDEEDEEDAAIGNKQQRRRRRRGFGKAKEVAMHQFTKAKNQLRRIRSRRSLLRSSSSSVNASRRGSSGKVFDRSDDNGSGCKFCFCRPRVLESPEDGSPPTSDPNDPNFTHAMLRALIEKNDFYSKECNPHVD